MEAPVHQRLAFRILIPIGLFGLAIGIVTVAILYFSVIEFVDQKAKNDLRWRSFAVYHIVDSRFDELQRRGNEGNEVASQRLRTNAMMEIENFARVNELKVTVRDLVRHTFIDLNESMPANPATVPFPGIIHRFLPNRYSEYTHIIRFEPWQLEIDIVQDNSSYLALFNGLLLAGGIAAFFFVAGVMAFMYYLNILGWKPIRSIIHDVEQNRPPIYSGIAEFEYLSGSIRKMMEAIQQHSGRLEALVAERTAALTERTTQLEKQTIELDHAKSAAETASRAKSAFLANMSHELRTPLNAVLGYAQILSRDPHLSDREKVGLNTIQKSGEHLLMLINDILDLSRLEAGNLDLLPAMVNTPSFLKTIANVIWAKAEEKDLSFSIDAAPDLPYAVYADSRRLRQVLLSLLDNAVKFTEKGHVKLRLRHQPLINSTSRLTFEVEDTGIGIDADRLKAIFQPFEQADYVAYRSGSAGLGLAISRQLVRLMDSDIEVESQLGQGSLFRFEIDVPVEEASIPDELQETTEEEKQTPILEYLPPREEMESLHRLAMAGNMRDIRKWADELVTRDQRFRPLADRLRSLADGYQSEAILELAEENLRNNQTHGLG